MQVDQEEQKSPGDEQETGEKKAGAEEMEVNKICNFRHLFILLK